MSAVTDSLMPEAVARHIGGRLGTPFLYEPECESTQLLLLGSGLPEGAVAVTDHQTAGRGRLGRAWEAPPRSSLLVSVLLHPPAQRHLPELALVAGVATAEAVEVATGLTAQIKWPNDVMLDRRKVAGILAEARDETVVLGVGINVHQSRDELPSAGTPACSLRTITGSHHDRAELLGSFLLRLERYYDAWREDGLDAVYGELGSRDFLRGRRVLVDGEPGTALQVDRAGRLVVQFDTGGPRTLESGEVQFER